MNAKRQINPCESILLSSGMSALLMLKRRWIVYHSFVSAALDDCEYFFESTITIAIARVKVMIDHE